MFYHCEFPIAAVADVQGEGWWLGVGGGHGCRGGEIEQDAPSTTDLPSQFTLDESRNS